MKTTKETLKLALRELVQDSLSDFEPKDSLNSKIFDGDKMRPDVRKALLDVAEKFMEFMRLKFPIKDIILTGSLSNYTWTPFSDLDVHLVTDFDALKKDSTLLSDYFHKAKNLFNNKHDIKIKGFDSEVYVQDEKEKHTSTGTYSIQDDKFITKPQKFTGENFDKTDVLKKFEYYAKQIDNLEDRLKRGDNVKDELEQLRYKLGRSRQGGLDRGGEYSNENIAYKYLRRKGYLDKAADLEDEAQSKELSIDESKYKYNLKK